MESCHLWTSVQWLCAPSSLPLCHVQARNLQTSSYVCVSHLQSPPPSSLLTLLILSFCHKMPFCHCLHGGWVISVLILVQDVDTQISLSCMLCNLWAVLSHLCFCLSLEESWLLQEENLGRKQHQCGIYKFLWGFNLPKLVIFLSNKSSLLICYGASEEKTQVIHNLLHVFGLLSLQLRIP